MLASRKTAKEIGTGSGDLMHVCVGGGGGGCPMWLYIEDDPYGKPSPRICQFFYLIVLRASMNLWRTGTACLNSGSCFFLK